MSLLQRDFRSSADWAQMAAVVYAQPSEHLHRSVVCWAGAPAGTAAAIGDW